MYAEETVMSGREFRGHDRNTVFDSGSCPREFPYQRQPLLKARYGDTILN